MPAISKSKRNIPNRALSVRQPYAEQIITADKLIEYRSVATNIRGRIYIYASKTLTARERQAYEEMGKEPDDLPVGVLVGTVEITGCTGERGDYEWHLANPKRLKKPLTPDNHPQPVWFKPFKQQKIDIKK